MGQMMDNVEDMYCLEDGTDLREINNIEKSKLPFDLLEESYKFNLREELEKCDEYHLQEVSLDNANELIEKARQELIKKLCYCDVNCFRKDKYSKCKFCIGINEVMGVTK